MREPLSNLDQENIVRFALRTSILILIYVAIVHFCGIIALSYVAAFTGAVLGSINDEEVFFLKVVTFFIVCLCVMLSEEFSHLRSFYNLQIATAPLSYLFYLSLASICQH